MNGFNFNKFIQTQNNLVLIYYSHLEKKKKTPARKEIMSNVHLLCYKIFINTLSKLISKETGMNCVN